MIAHEDDIVLFVGFQTEVGCSGDDATDGAEFFGHKGGDLLEVGTLDDDHEIVATGHEVTALYLVEFGDALGEAIMGLAERSLRGRIAALPDPLATHLVFDDLIWEHAGREARIPPNPQLELAGGGIHRGDTLEELAQLGADFISGQQKGWKAFLKGFVTILIKSIQSIYQIIKVTRKLYRDYSIFVLISTSNRITSINRLS